MIRELVGRYLAGDLSGEELDSLERHLASCGACREVFGEARRYEAALRRAFADTVSKSRSPRSRVLRKIEAQEPPRRPGKTLVNWFAFLLAAGAMGILVAAAYISYEKIRQDNLRKSARAKSQLAELARALQEYHARHGTYPLGANARMTQALLPAIGKSDLFRYRPADSVLTDPWGTPFVYRSDGNSFSLHSAGPDRRDDGGGSDDLPP